MLVVPSRPPDWDTDGRERPNAADAWPKIDQVFGRIAKLCIVPSDHAFWKLVNDEKMKSLPGEHH